MPMNRRNLLVLLPFSLLALNLQGCSTAQWTPSAGPNLDEVTSATQPGNKQIHLVDVTAATVQLLQAAERNDSFAQRLGNHQISSISQVVGAGDTLEVSVWEAPPALLFGTSALGSSSSTSASHVTAFPPQMVSADGTIQIPFGGAVPAAGRTTQQIQSDVVSRLTGKANQPQAMVRIQSNASSDVTVVGEVNQNLRMPLSPKGERLLDALAAAGGARQAVNKVSVQITRGHHVLSMPLERVVQEPVQNVPMMAGDVITVMYQPKSFTVLGAAGKNAEIDFEGSGISLAQALARAGGIRSTQGDPNGVFIFRFEEPRALGTAAASLPRTPDGKIATVYRLDMKNPASFLNAQNFPMRNKDVLYIADAPSVDLQKFLGILTSSIYSLNTLGNLAD